MKRLTVLAIAACLPLIVADLPGQEQAADAQMQLPALRQTSTHPMQYFLSLPRNYRKVPGKRWSALVCVAGAHANFQYVAKSFQERRGDLPLVIAVPCTFSNTNALTGSTRNAYREFYDDDVIDSLAERDARLSWDERGLLAMLRDLSEQYGAAEQIYMTGFSGGGMATYHMIGRHPERLAAAIPVCGNYFGGLLDGTPPRSDRARALPIHQFLGELDPLNGPRGLLPIPPALTAALFISLGAGLGYVAGKRLKGRWSAAAVLVIVIAGGLWLSQLRFGKGLEQQADWAAHDLRELGYSSVRRTVIPGMGHSEGPEHVFAIIAPLLNVAAAD
jgi:pimeloyl-ACP methyl ester carboxylesterase